MNSAISILTIASIYTVLAEVISYEQLRVIGGHSDVERQLSWVVLLFKSDNQGKCTGSLISPVWVLSAAHCTATGERVYLYENGQPFSLKRMDQLQYSTVLLIITHEKFATIISVEGNNDIALYKITATTVPKYGKLSAIDYKSLAGREVSVMGFGRDKWYSALEDEMNKNFSFSVASGVITQCDGSDTMNLKLANKPIICIMRPCGEVGLVAPGDSGGPVVYDGSIVGINSFAPAPEVARAFIPDTTVSVYTIYACPISIHLDWIHKKLLDNLY